jgi:A/G-specific adenine glycosylase
MTRAPSSLAGRVVAWQRSHGRHHLPWQNTRDPYRVWLSEVMLQQTQVTTVLDYYQRFLERFPTVADLAAASQDDVLALWSGLGYYSRARNLHRCAQEVVERFGGRFPERAELLATLPGIGRSTAAAISSFCFGERVAILDGNVKRVLGRALGFDLDLARAAHEKLLWHRAEALLPEREADMPAYTQGLMDLGATVCLARQPRCTDCPLKSDCVAMREGRPEAYPVKSRTLRRSAQSLWLLWASDDEGRVWLQRRPATGIWAGLHALPVFESEADLLAALPMDATVEMRPVFTHVLTHKDLHLHPARVCLGRSSPAGVEGEWVSDWAGRGLPAPMRRLLETG